MGTLAAITVGQAIAGAAVAGAAGQIGGSLIQGAAADRSAEAQQAAAQQGIEEQRRTRRLAQAAAEPSFEELGSISRLLETRELALQKSIGALQKQEELLAAVDPAIKEAGQQALQLLQGEEAKALDPIRRNRDRQRLQLEGQLRDRLGGGFRTSSAGLEALSRFDAATDEALFGAQQQATQQFLQVAVAARPDLIGDIGRVTQTIGGVDRSVLAAQQNIEARQLGAITQTPISFQNVQQAAAQTGAGDAVRGSALGSLGSDILGGATTFGTLQALGATPVANVAANGSGINFGAVGSGSNIGSGQIDLSRR